ncbi:uncharacterized protein LOC131313926 [Rhododendron vialii]|uniref:uncharacterized protein LOC131313926 n=1 Tax=Rhododendron vialii TaxID=182163 RepID=UPI00265E430F|nr:uncharacterized protein LOC131313926 [Rhododendron vialii]
MPFPATNTHRALEEKPRDPRKKDIIDTGGKSERPRHRHQERRRIFEPGKATQRFTMPKLKRYEAKEDAVAFVCCFRQTMSLHNFSDVLMCKIFPLMLSEPIMLWYNQLKPKSITCFNELELEFTKRFVTSNVKPKTLSMLVNMKRAAGETLRLYTERYWEVYNLIPDCDQGFVAESFMNGLDPSSAMFRDLSRNPPKTMGELITIIEKDCVHEEAVAKQKVSKISESSKMSPAAKK